MQYTRYKRVNHFHPRYKRGRVGTSGTSGVGDLSANALYQQHKHNGKYYYVFHRKFIRYNG